MRCGTAKGGIFQAVGAGVNLFLRGAGADERMGNGTHGDFSQLLWRAVREMV